MVSKTIVSPPLILSDVFAKWEKLVKYFKGIVEIESTGSALSNSKIHALDTNVVIGCETLKAYRKKRKYRLKQFKMSEAREDFTGSQTRKLLKSWFSVTLPIHCILQDIEIHCGKCKSNLKMKEWGKKLRKSGGKEKQELEQRILELSLQGRKRGREEREEREFGAGRDREQEWRRKTQQQWKLTWVHNFKAYGLSEILKQMTNFYNISKEKVNK